jgi:PAS domain S-box-containing protein
LAEEATPSAQAAPGSSPAGATQAAAAAATPSGQAAPGSSPAGATQAWLARAVVNEAAEAIVVTDPDGIIRLWNNGAERVFGYSAAEAVGQNLDLIIPEKLRERHWKGYRQTMATGHTRYGDQLLSVPAAHRDGRRLSIEFSVALLNDDAGRIVGISAIMREVTDRRNADKALRARLAELERRVGSVGSADDG